jgi:hypothetical protein
MKYFAEVPTTAAVNDLPHNPCRLLGLKLIRLGDKTGRRRDGRP